MGVLKLGVLTSSLAFVRSSFDMPTARCLGIVLLGGSLLFCSHAQAQSEDGIAWLQKEMNCDQLTVEMKRRYSTLGNFSQLTEAKRQEVSLVLDIICGARFAHCGFKNCQKLSPTSQTQVQQSASPTPIETPSFLEPLPPPPPAVPAPIVAIDFPAEAKKMLEEKIRKHQEFLKVQIAKSVEQENSDKRTWVKVSVLAEEESLQEEELPSGSLFPPNSTEEESPKNSKKSETKSETPNFAPPADSALRRPRLNPEFAAASPATPMMALPIPGTMGKISSRYLPKSSPDFHKIPPDSAPSFQIKSRPN